MSGSCLNMVIMVLLNLLILFSLDLHSGIIVIIALLCGILAVVFQKFFIIVSTAFAGASGIVYGGTALFRGDSISDILLSLAFGGFSRHNSAQSLAVLVLAILGIINQYRTVSKTTSTTTASRPSDCESQVDANVPG